MVKLLAHCDATLDEWQMGYLAAEERQRDSLVPRLSHTEGLNVAAEEHVDIHSQHWTPQDLSAKLDILRNASNIALLNVAFNTADFGRGPLWADLTRLARSLDGRADAAQILSLGVPAGKTMAEGLRSWRSPNTSAAQPHAFWLRPARAAVSALALTQQTLLNMTAEDRNMSALLEEGEWSPLLAQSFHDAVYLYGWRLGQCLEEEACDPGNGSALAQAMAGAAFRGLAGPVRITRRRNLRSSFLFTSTGPSGRDEVYFKAVIDEEDVLNFAEVAEFPWATADGEPPRDVIVKEEEEFSVRLLLAAFGGASGAVLLGFLALHVVRQRRFESALLAKAWEMEQRSLHFLQPPEQRRPLSVTAAPLDYGAVVEQAKGTRRLGYLGPARLKGKLVAVKGFPLRDGFRTSERGLRVGLKALAELRHENLAGLEGLCWRPRERLLVAWELGQKGSLADILPNADVHLDDAFRVSIVRDIVNGLQYLHASSVRVHGSLWAGSCVVDGRWTVKLTNFGLAEVLAEQARKGGVVFPAFTAEKLLATAPELSQHRSSAETRNKSLVSHPATQEADVYSLGCVVWQLLTRQPLLASASLGEDEVAEAARSGSLVHWRPRLPKTGLPEAVGPELRAVLEPLMRKCWDGVPAQRPRLSAVGRIVRSLEGARGSLAEGVASLMETYAAGLEKALAARTTELAEERCLRLSQAGKGLPASVASLLSLGRPFPPTSADATLLALKIEDSGDPLQLLQEGDKVRRCLEEVLDDYPEACLAEAEGKAWLVAFGLGAGGGRDCEGEEAVAGAKTALALVGKAPGVRLALHSGPASAAVLGQRLPRFAVRGEAAELARRLVSQSQPAKVLASEDTGRLLAGSLRARTHFRLKLRGPLALKAHKAQESLSLNTYWLTESQDLL